MKRGLKALLSVMIVVTLVVGGLVYLSNVTERKDSVNKFAQFYEQEEDFDVLFIGQSHVLNGIFPMELWNDYGIVSYNMAGHGNHVPTTYWVMENALDYTNPELIVLDCGMLAKEEKTGTIEQLHLSIDHIPFSENKVKMIQDLLGDSEQKWDFLWKFSTYHNRWNEVDGADFEAVSTVEKGAESRIAVAVPDELCYWDPIYKTQGETTGIQYMRRIIEECQARGIDILLTYLPFPDSSGWQAESYRAWDIASEYGVNYLDYHTLLAEINLNTDCYDTGSHLNPSGARKITKYLGEYIMENYDIEDQRNDEAYSDWHEDYQVYTEFKIDNIREQDDIKSHLMLLYDKNLSYGIYLKQGGNLEEQPVLIELLNNIGIDYSQIPEEESYFVFADNLKQEIIMIKPGESMETSFGNITMIYNEDGSTSLRLDENDNLIPADIEIGTLVFDHMSMKCVSLAKFSTGESEITRIRGE